MLDVSEGLGLAVLGVGLEADAVLSAEVGVLVLNRATMGLEVVWWPKVLPVGFMFGGYFDL